MAAVLTGTPVEIDWAAGADPAGQSITIPADATAVYMFWGYAVGSSGNGLASAALNSVAPDGTSSFELASVSTYEMAIGVAVWFNPATGSQTLDVAWDVAPEEGPSCIVAFVKDGNLGAPTDVDAAHGVGAAAVSTTLTTVVGDLVLKFDVRYNVNVAGNPALSAGWTNGQVATTGVESSRLSYISAAGTSQVCDSETEEYSGVLAISIPASGGAAPAADQEGARFGVDDGSESAHTWSQAQDANDTVSVGTARLIRALINGTGDLASATYTLRYQKNGAGGYLPVPVGSGVAEAYAQPTWGAVGTAASGTNTANPSFPTGISASTSKLLAVCTGRSDTASSAFTAPAGWTSLGQLEGGTGTFGVDTGTRRVGFFIKDTVTGSESGTTGNFGYTAGGATNSTLRVSVFRVEVPAGYSLDTEFVSGDDTTNGTGYSAAASSSATFDANRLVLIGTAQNIDTGTATSRAISATGITFGTVTNRADTAVTNGNDHRHILNSVPVSSGSGTVAPTFSYTISASGSGPTGFLVLRARLPAIVNEIYIAASANIVAGGEATTARLTAPSGKTASDFVAGRRWGDENGADALDITVDDYTEIEWCLNTQSPAINGDYFDFRVYAGAAALDTYTVTPRLTLGAPAGASSLPADLLLQPGRSARLATLLRF